VRAVRVASLPVPAHRRRWSDAAVHRHVRWSPVPLTGFAGKLEGAATFLGDFLEISRGPGVEPGTASWAAKRGGSGRHGDRTPRLRRLFGDAQARSNVPIPPTCQSVETKPKLRFVVNAPGRERMRPAGGARA
jgi:hypothetical protein